MRFLPFQNQHTASGKQEFINNFLNAIHTDDISQEMINLTLEMTSDFYGFMFAFISGAEVDINDYNFLAENICMHMYVRMYGLLQSDQNYIIKKEIYTKLYVHTIEEFHRLRRNENAFADIENLCGELSNCISKKYFELIQKLKNYEEPYDYEYSNHWQYGHRKIFSQYYKENILNKHKINIDNLITKCNKYVPFIVLFMSLVLTILSVPNTSNSIIQLLYSICLIIFTGGIIAIITYQDILTERQKDNPYIFFSSTSLATQLGVDTLKMLISENLIPTADPHQQNEILPDIQKVRLHLTDDYGYIIPNIRVMDCPSLAENTIIFEIREKEELRFEYYPEKLVVRETILKIAGVNIENLRPAKNILSDAKLYWVDKKLIKNISENDCTPAREYFKEIIYELAMRNVDKILTPSSVFHYMELGKLEHEGFTINPYKYCDLETLRDILAALLTERISIKDVIFILEKIRIYASRGLYPEDIVRNIKKDLK